MNIPYSFRVTLAYITVHLSALIGIWANHISFDRSNSSTNTVGAHFPIGILKTRVIDKE